MKKISFLLVFFVAFVFVGCGEADPKPFTPADNEVSDDEGGNQAEDDGETQNDGEVVPERDNEPAADDDEPAASDDDPNTEEPDETENPDENNGPVNPGEAIGTFNLSYSGQINASVSMQSRGGNGKVDFTYNEMPNTFEEITIPMVGTLFPLAMLNSGNIIIVWLDGFGAGDISGDAQKQVFGISVPQNTEIGSGNMASAGIYAFFGDMTVNVMGGKFEINCVRTVTNVGNYEVTANDGANITLTASGDLLDPAAGAAYLPYPACE